MTSELQQADWNRLLRRIQSGKCTPLLGAGACYGALPLGADLAQELAQRYDYPFPDRDLVRVAQYAAIQSDPNAPKEDVVDIMLKVRAGAYSFEAANPRHEHEWRVWERVKLPEGALLVPGVITQSTILVEHPELVAERIVKFAKVVGRENVIAGSDCGFATFAGSTEIHPSVVWAKLKALSDGARIATKQLWGRA